MLVVITNQSGIGLGLYGHDDVAQVHAYLRDRLAEQGMRVGRCVLLPSSPQQGRCLCRKPGSLLLRRPLPGTDRSGPFDPGGRQGP